MVGRYVALRFISGTTHTMSGPRPIGILAQASVRSAAVMEAPGSSVTADTATSCPPTGTL